MYRNTSTSYGLIAKSFHWLLFLMFGFLVAAGNFLADMPKGAEKLEAAGMHKSFGVVVLILVLARLGWRLANESPKAPVGTSALMGFLADGLHWALYALMLAQPIAGILMSQAAGLPVSVFGVFELPAMVGDDPELAKLFRTAHGTIWILLVVSVAGHVGASLYHHFVEKDDVLRRMSFAAKR